MPAGAANVTRPGRFGNPFVGARAVEAFRHWLLVESTPARMVATQYGCKLADKAQRWAIASGVMRELFHLKGRDLACYCPLDKPCHADALLELANK